MPGGLLWCDIRGVIVSQGVTPQGVRIKQSAVHTCQHVTSTFAEKFVGDENFCRRLVNQKKPSGRVLGGLAWLTSVTLAVIGPTSNNVGLQFGGMATDVADTKISPTFSWCLQQMSAICRQV